MVLFQVECTMVSNLKLLKLIAEDKFEEFAKKIKELEDKIQNMGNQEIAPQII